MPKTTINLTERDLEIVRKLQEDFDTSTLNDAIRQAVAQSSVINRYVNKHGELVVIKENGDTVTIARK